MRETGPAASRQSTGSRAVVSAFVGTVLLAAWGCSPAAEEAVTAETILDGGDAPAETLEIEVVPTSRPVDGAVADDEAATDSGVDEPDAATSADGAVTDPSADEPRGDVDVSGPSDATPTTTNTNTTAPSPTTPPIDPPVVAPESSADGGNGAGGPAISVSARDLVGVADQTADPADDCDEAMPCAGQPPPPGDGRGDVSIGEYQRDVRIPLGAEVDIYFDQSRSYALMFAVCLELGGHLLNRGEDGSRWAGWYYCHAVDY